MGGGYDAEGRLQLGKLPTAEEFGGGWDYNYDEVLRGGRGREVYLQKVAGSKSWGMNWDEDVCQGAQDCARACPYKKIYFNVNAKVSQHCIGCFPRLEQGVAPACVRQCPGRAAFVGFKDDTGSAVFKLVERWKVALPLHPEWGTEPNVYYVPPLAPAPLREDGSFDEGADRIPPSYLEELFGPAVHGALDVLRTELDKKRRGLDSELMDQLILYRWQDCLGHLSRDPADIVWK